MSDIKLFRVGNGGVDELQGRFVAVEKSLQALIEILDRDQWRTSRRDGVRAVYPGYATCRHPDGELPEERESRFWAFVLDAALEHGVGRSGRRVPPSVASIPLFASPCGACLPRNGATRGKLEKRKPRRNAGIANSCKPLQRSMHHS